MEVVGELLGGAVRNMEMAEGTKECLHLGVVLQRPELTEHSLTVGAEEVIDMRPHLRLEL